MIEKILGVIPIRGADQEFADGKIPMLGKKSLLDYTFDAVKESKKLDRVIVSTDSRFIADLCKSKGIDAPFLRPPELSQSSATVTDVLLHALSWLEKNENYQPAWVVKLEVTHPFRPKGLIDMLIDTAMANGVDSAFLAHEEISSFWTLNEDGKPRLLGSSIDSPRKTRSPFYRDFGGLGSITRTSNLKAGQLYGSNLGLIPFRDFFATVDTHDGAGEKRGLKLAELLAPAYDAGPKVN